MTGTGTNKLQRYRQAIRYFIYSQIGFFLSLIVCILLLPQGLLANQGFTYYGEHARTIVPYRIAFFLSGLSIFLASWLLPNEKPFRVMKIAFRLMIPLLLGLVLTTSSVNLLLGRIHVRFGETLFVLQLVLGSWLALIVWRDLVNQAFLMLLLFSILASSLALFDVIPYLLQGQILFELTFGILVTYTLIKLRSSI